MRLLALREYPAMDAETLAEFTGCERLFCWTDGSFLLHMSSENQSVIVEERIIRLSPRDALSWLNDGPDQLGLFWEIAEVIPAL
jgi:hypothetical protein